jgi:signal transduction histidine kinase
MRERTRLLGGRTTVTSRPGKGTRVVASVPLPNEASVGESAGGELMGRRVG